MANKCKNPSERKSVYLGVRVTPRQKKHWEQLAANMGMTSSQLLKEMLESFLEDPNWKKKYTWEFIKAAADVIDKDEKNIRNKKNREGYRHE